MIAASGAPFDQGRAQGMACRDEIRRILGRLRERYPALGWLAARCHARRGPGRATACFLPQQHERLEGIARGAGVPLAALELLESLQRVEGAVAVVGGGLEGSFEVPPELAPGLRLRRSDPGAGGMPSVEITAAPWAGCLAGVNAQGVAVVCLADHGLGDPSVRLLAQDLLFRARALEPGVEHLRHRAGYAGGSGVLVARGDGEPVLRLGLRSGKLEVEPLRPRSRPGLAPMLRIDAAARTLSWRDPAGGVQTVRPAGAPSDR